MNKSVYIRVYWSEKLKKGSSVTIFHDCDSLDEAIGYANDLLLNEVGFNIYIVEHREYSCDTYPCTLVKFHEDCFDMEVD